MLGGFFIIIYYSQFEGKNIMVSLVRFALQKIRQRTDMLLIRARES